MVDEIWTSEYPACVNDFDAEGIYEGVKLHKFNFKKDVTANPEFFKDKKNIAFKINEMTGFVFAWYDNCAQRRTIANVVDVSDWILDYQKCYKNIYWSENFYEGALGYYETLASHKLHEYIYRTQNEPVYVDGLGKLNPMPEITWMLADYLYNNHTSVWANYLTEVIRKNIRDIKFSKAMFNRACGADMIVINLRDDLTIDEIDFTDPQAVLYFDNPFSNDFHTNFEYIKRLIVRERKLTGMEF